MERSPEMADAAISARRRAPPASPLFDGSSAGSAIRPSTMKRSGCRGLAARPTATSSIQHLSPRRESVDRNGVGAGMFTRELSDNPSVRERRTGDHRPSRQSPSPTGGDGLCVGCRS